MKETLKEKTKGMTLRGAFKEGRNQAAKEAEARRRLRQQSSQKVK